ncbi:hypothetical protein [Nocardia sp. SC052]|uniref:hypothetical protein n=1 Tax=Nocardia sichangensis TaxID=3385975 RepID=UPI0039A348D2
MASDALADYVVEARIQLQALVDLLGAPDYAVAPPVTTPDAPPEKPTAANMTGISAAAYSTLRTVLESHSEVWRAADGTVVITAQRAATVGLAALQQIKYLVHQLQEMFDATDLDPVVPAFHTKISSGSGGLASYTEYRLAITIQQALHQAGHVVDQAQMELGIDAISPMPPRIPSFPEQKIPPHPAPMPELQRNSPNSGTLEV